jgi:hypothetical protein
MMQWHDGPINIRARQILYVAIVCALLVMIAIQISPWIAWQLSPLP